MAVFFPTEPLWDAIDFFSRVHPVSALLTTQRRTQEGECCVLLNSTYSIGLRCISIKTCVAADLLQLNTCIGQAQWVARRQVPGRFFFFFNPPPVSVPDDNPLSLSLHTNLFLWFAISISEDEKVAASHHQTMESVPFDFYEMLIAVHCCFSTLTNFSGLCLSFHLILFVGIINCRLVLAALCVTWESAFQNKEISQDRKLNDYFSWWRPWKYIIQKNIELLAGRQREYLLFRPN